MLPMNKSKNKTRYVCNINKNAIPHHVLTLILYIFDVANPELQLYMYNTLSNVEEIFKLSIYNIKIIDLECKIVTLRDIYTATFFDRDF